MAEEKETNQTNNESTTNAAENIKKRAPINLTIEPEEPKGFVHTLTDLMDRALNLQRKDEQGILNESNGAGVVVRKDGQVNLAASKYSQYKLAPNGRTVEQAMESVTITNRRKLLTEEIVVNEHKLNPQLWELADFRNPKLPTNDHAFVGNLCLFGSVLVKAWEPNLKRYMLIRRPWLGPMFGPLLNVAEINPALGINDPLKFTEDILALSDKGYQVNGIIKDAKSLIGKSGEDRSGIIRNTDAMTGNEGNKGSSAGFSGGYNGSVNTNIPSVGKAPGKGVENIPKGQSPQWAIDMCVRCSKGCGIPADWLYAQFRNESANFESPCAKHNYGGMSSPSGGWMSFDSPDEFADYMAKVLPRWVGSDGKSTTDAKTMHEYVIALQTDSSPYCAEPPGVDPYYSVMLNILGNQGTVID